MRRWLKLVHVASCGAVIGSAGCVSLGRTETPLEHYVLGAVTLHGDSTPAGAMSDLTVGVRRLELASYLASPFMVVRRGANQVDFAEFRRWGEPLEAGINRVVAGALIARGFREVAVAPWPSQARFSYVIQLEVVRFEGMTSEDSYSTEGGALVLAMWEISNQLDGRVLASGTTRFERQGWQVGNFPGLVTFLDEGLGVIADDLALALMELPPVMDESRVP